MDRRGWHLDKGIGAAHILTTITFVVTAIFYVTAQDKRLAVLESGFVYVQQASVRDQARTEKKFDELKVDLRVIGGKLDRLNESLNRRD